MEGGRWIEEGRGSEGGRTGFKGGEQVLRGENRF